MSHFSFTICKNSVFVSSWNLLLFFQESGFDKIMWLGVNYLSITKRFEIFQNLHVLALFYCIHNRIEFFSEEKENNRGAKSLAGVQVSFSKFNYCCNFKYLAENLFVWNSAKLSSSDCGLVSCTMYIVHVREVWCHEICIDFFVLNMLELVI